MSDGQDDEIASRPTRFDFSAPCEPWGPTTLRLSAPCGKSRGAAARDVDDRVVAQSSSPRAGAPGRPPARQIDASLVSPPRLGDRDRALGARLGGKSVPFPYLSAEGGRFADRRSV